MFSKTLVISKMIQDPGLSLETVTNHKLFSIIVIEM